MNITDECLIKEKYGPIFKLHLLEEVLIGKTSKPQTFPTQIKVRLGEWLCLMKVSGHQSPDVPFKTNTADVGNLCKPNHVFATSVVTQV